VAAQRAAAHLGRDSGSPEPGVARAMGHCFRRGLTLRTQRNEGNSPRGSSRGGGDWSRAHDGGRLTRSFGVVDNELQWSADNKIRLRGGGAMHRRATWCWFGAARPPMERW
jgi:hypothetical protein